MMRSAAGLIAVILFLSSCENPTIPRLAEVTAQVTRLPGGFNNDVEIAITLSNSLSDTVYFDFCRTVLERQDEGGGWDSVAGILCNAIGYVNPLHGMIAIAPGASREIRLHFGAFTGSSHELDGNHRVRVFMNAGPPVSWWDFIGSLSFQSLTTNEFIPASM